MGRQSELLEKLPRKTRGQLMHVCDAGETNGLIVQMRCGKCGYESDWMHMSTVTEAKRGLPCPKCTEVKQ